MYFGGNAMLSFPIYEDGRPRGQAAPVGYVSRKPKPRYTVSKHLRGKEFQHRAETESVSDENLPLT